MTLKPREAAILWTVVGVMLAAVLWTVGIEPIWNDYSLRQELLETAEAKYADNKKILAGAARIEEEFNRIKQAIPQESTDEQSAKYAFSEDVNKEATTMLGGRPTVGTPGSQPMKDVPGFSLITFPITAFGELEPISKLLKAFDQKGYLVQRVVISQKDIDTPELKLDLELARIVQIVEEEKTQRRRLGFGSGGASR